MNRKIWGVLVALVLVFGVSSLAQAAGTITQLDTVYISVDQYADSTTTEIIGPTIAEASAGDFDSTIVISVDLAVGNFLAADSVVVSGKGLITFAADKVAPDPTTGKITFTITQKSTTGPDTLTFSGIKVFPTTKVAKWDSTTFTDLQVQEGQPTALQKVDTGNAGHIVLLPGASKKLTFDPAKGGQQPGTTGGSDAGTDFNPQPWVVILDQYDNRTADITTTVTLAPVLAGTSIPGNGSLQGTTAKTATSAAPGIVKFTGLDYTKAESIQLKATATGLTSATSNAITVTAGDPAKVTFSSDKSTLTVLETATLTVTLTDQYFNPVDGGEKVVFSEVTAVGGSFTADTVATSTANGTCTNVYTPSHFYVGDVTLKAAADGYAGVEKTLTLSITPGPLGNVNLTPATKDMVVGTSATFTAELVDAFGNHIDASSTDEVTFSATNGVVGAKSLTADKDIAVEYTAQHTAGKSDTLTVTTVSGGYTDYSVITTKSGPPATMKFIATDSTVVASDSTLTEALVDSVWDEYGNLSDGYWVHFAVTSGVGTMSADSVKSVAGKVDVNYISGPVAQTETVTASYGSLTASLNIVVKPAATAKLVVPDTIWTQAGQPVTLEAKEYDQFDNHVTETDSSKVTFTKISGQGTLAAPDTRQVNAAGNVTIVYTAYAVTADTALIQAVYSGVTPDTTVVINTPPGVLDHFEIAFDDTSVSVVDSIKVTITAKDPNDIRIWTYTGAGETITLNGSAATAAQFSWHPKPGWAGAEIEDQGLNAYLPDSAFVDGQVEFYMLNQKAEGPLTFTIADTALGVSTTSGDFYFTPDDVAALAVTAPDTVYAGTAFNFTVTPKDQYGNVNTTQTVYIQVSANYPDELDLAAVERKLKGPATYSTTASTARTDLKLAAYESVTHNYYGESADITVLPAPVPVVDAPDTLIVTDVPGDNGGWVQVNFPVSASDLEGGGYILYREVPVAGDTTGATTWEIWATCPDVAEDNVVVTLSTAPYYTDVTNWGVRAVKAPYFSSLTQGITPKLSVADGQVSVMTYGIGGAVDNIAPAAPAELRAVDNPGDTGGAVLLTWALSPDDKLVDSRADISGRQNQIYGVTGYEIYRNGELIATVDRGVTTYVDVTAENNVTYTYLVKAVDGTFAVESLTNVAIAVDNTLLADFSSNLKVWTEDFAMFVNNFGLGEADVEFDPVFDLDGNGKVWTEDFTIFVGQFGQTAGAAKAIASAEGLNTGASAALDISREGAAITIDVSAQGLSELASYGLKVSFDPEALQFLGASEGNLLRNNSLFVAIPTGAGEVWVLNGQPEAVSATSGLLSQLHFKALNDQAIGSAIRVDALELFDSDARLNSIATQGLEVTVAPEKFALLQNYPNPGNPSTVISYTLARDSKVNLTIYNTLGQTVKTLVDGYQAANIYKVVWDGRDDSGKEVASGVYFYRLVAGDFSATKRLIVLK